MRNSVWGTLGTAAVIMFFAAIVTAALLDELSFKAFAIVLFIESGTLGMGYVLAEGEHNARERRKYDHLND